MKIKCRYCNNPMIINGTRPRGAGREIKCFSCRGLSFTGDYFGNK